MKFSLSSFLFPALLVLSTEVIPGVAGDQAAPTFPPTDLNAGRYEYGIEVVVGSTSGSEDDAATDMVEGVDPFTVTSFFEVSTKYDGRIAELITVEVYTTVIGDSEDDCSKGTLIEDGVCEEGDCFTISYEAFDSDSITGTDFPSPRIEDNIVGATTVVFSNFMLNEIYVANEDPAETDGTVEFCVRTSIKLGDETVSHIDSKKKFLINLSGNIAASSASRVVFEMEICSTNCENLVTQLNQNEMFKGQVRNIVANNTAIDGDTVMVQIVTGSGTCLSGCTVTTSRRFLYPFETDKAVSSVTSEFSGRQLQSSASTVVNVIVYYYAANGQSVDPAQLLVGLETNMDTLNEGGAFTIESIVVAADQSVGIEKKENKNFEATVVKEIDIETFVCNIRNERIRANRSYKIGEQFRICVGPQEAAIAEGYEIDNFIEVTCGTDTAGRSLVADSIESDILTLIDPLPLKNNQRAIRSVITTGYAVDGNTNLQCTGRVSLSYTAPIRGRALQNLQPSTGLEGLFEMNIEMDIPSNESSASLPSSMTTTVAVIGFGSILSVVSSMIW